MSNNPYRVFAYANRYKKIKIKKPLIEKNRKKRKTKRTICDTKEWKILRTKIFKRDGNFCRICGDQENIMHIDHIKPKSKYPELQWDEQNLQVLCKRCNFKKNTKVII